MDIPPIHAEDHGFHIEQLVAKVTEHAQRIEGLETHAQDMKAVREGVEKLVQVLNPATLEEVTRAVAILQTTRRFGNIIFWLSVVCSGVALTWSSIVEILKYAAHK